MSSIIFGDCIDVNTVERDVDHDRLLLFVHGAHSEIRQENEHGPLVLPIADERWCALERRIYKIEPYGIDSKRKIWVWFVRYERRELGERTASVLLEFSNEGVSWMPKEEPADWSVLVRIGDYLVDGPYVESFANLSAEEALPEFSKRLKRG